MARLTLYMDAETEKRLPAAARAAGWSMSQWVRELVRLRTATEWPASVARLRGAWADVPTVQRLRSRSGKDASREQF